MSRPLSIALLDEPRSELAMLLLASFAVVTTILLAVLQASSVIGAEPRLQVALLISTVFAGAAGAATIWLRRHRGDEQDSVATVFDPAQSQLSLEAIVAAEPQVLAFWEIGHPVRIVSHTLRTVPGIPQDARDLEALGGWLDDVSERDLRASLDVLFTEAKAFNLIIKTRAGGNLEAEGSTAGGRAVLRLRDLVGYKRDLATILERNRTLSAEQASMRALLDSLPNAVWLKSADGQMAWANRAYVTATEGTIGENDQRTVADLLDRRQMDVANQALLATGRYVERLPLGHGAERVDHDVTVLRVQGGTVGIAMDATAVESAHEELTRQLAAYDRTLHGVATGTVIFGSDGRLSFYNTAWRALFEIDADWLALGPTLGELLDRLNTLGRLPFGGDYRTWRQSFLDVVADPDVAVTTPVSHQTWWHLFDGRTIHVTTERQVDGTVVGLFDDVTAAITLESRYNELIATQREPLDTLKEAVAVFGPDGRLRLFNSAFAQSWRFSRAMLAERPHIEALFEPCRATTEDDRPWARLAQAVTSLEEDRGAVEGQMVRRDGVVLDYAATPLSDGATLLTFFDVTKAKNFEQALLDKVEAERDRAKALEQANDALSNADRLKSQLISHVSYEFRTPLTTILGYAEFMEAGMTGSLNARQHETLSAISSAGKTLLAIFDDILDLALIESGGLELKRAPTSVGHIVNGAIEAVTNRAAIKGVEIVARIADPDDIVVADDQRMRQVLYNLLSNAVGFSPTGSHVILTTAASANAITFSISDNGVGIPTALQARMFDRFESRSQGSNHRGAGLGLAIVRSLVNLHGGSIAVESEPGHGTTITVSLPKDGVMITTSHGQRVEDPQLALPLFA